MCKISAQYVKVCRRKVRKTGGRTDGDPDGRTESAKFQLNMSKYVGEKCGKRADGRTDGDPDGRTESRTDGDPDGHHHTIIRPV